MTSFGKEKKGRKLYFTTVLNKGGRSASTANTTITDDVNYTSNYPQYTYYWTVPATVQVYVKVTLENNDYLSSDIVSDVQAAVISAFNGEDGGTRARIGSTIYSGRYYGGIQDIDQQNVNILLLYSIPLLFNTFGSVIASGYN